MSDKEFVDLVRTMRNAQTIYFRSKNWSDLRYARDYEQRVDNDYHRQKHYRDRQGRKRYFQSPTGDQHGKACQTRIAAARYQFHRGR